MNHFNSNDRVEVMVQEVHESLSGKEPVEEYCDTQKHTFIYNSPTVDPIKDSTYKNSSGE